MKYRVWTYISGSCWGSSHPESNFMELMKIECKGSETHVICWPYCTVNTYLRGAWHVIHLCLWASIMRDNMYLIWDFYSSKDSCCGIVGYDTVWSDRGIIVLEQYTVYIFMAQREGIFPSKCSHLPDYRVLHLRTSQCGKWP